MAIDFPSSPAVGQQYVFNGVTYTFTAQGTWVTATGGAYTASSTAPTSPTPGDNWYDLSTGILSIYVNDGNSSQWVQINGVAGASSQPQQCGRLAYVSPTSLSFNPYNGDRIKINGVIYPLAIGGAGINGLGNIGVFVNGVGVQNLAVGTTYLVCAFINGGQVWADYLTTVTHAPSNTAGNVGVEIPTGLDTRTVIGMVRTDGSAQFQNATNFRGVISWFNRRNIPMVGTVTTNTVTSTSFVEITVSARINFVTWGEEAVTVSMVGLSTNNAVAHTYLQIYADGTAPRFVSSYSTGEYTVSFNMPVAGTVHDSVSEGFHYYTPFAMVTAGTGNFNLSLTGIVRG